MHVIFKSVAPKFSSWTEGHRCPNLLYCSCFVAHNEPTHDYVFQQHNLKWGQDWMCIQHCNDTEAYFVFDHFSLLKAVTGSNAQHVSLMLENENTHFLVFLFAWVLCLCISGPCPCNLLAWSASQSPACESVTVTSRCLWQVPGTRPDSLPQCCNTTMWSGGYRFYSVWTAAKQMSDSHQVDQHTHMFLGHPLELLCGYLTVCMLCIETEVHIQHYTEFQLPGFLPLPIDSSGRDLHSCSMALGMPWGLFATGAKSSDLTLLWAISTNWQQASASTDARSEQCPVTKLGIADATPHTLILLPSHS